jgi:cytoskeletal protein CcmA (bactofilin family)
MFSKNSKASNGSAGLADARPDMAVKAVPSIISADLTIDGNLNSGGEIQVDGVVNGDIRCKALIVGVKGSVIGEVVAQTVRMHGAIKGMIRAKSVFLASTARMSGDVEHESLAIEPGAYMEGHCKRITEVNVAPVEVPRAERPMIGAARVGAMTKTAIAGT